MTTVFASSEGDLFQSEDEEFFGFPDLYALNSQELLSLIHQLNGYVNAPLYEEAVAEGVQFGPLLAALCEFAAAIQSSFDVDDVSFPLFLDKLSEVVTFGPVVSAQYTFYTKALQAINLSGRIDTLGDGFLSESLGISAALETLTYRVSKATARLNLRTAIEKVLWVEKKVADITQWTDAAAVLFSLVVNDTLTVAEGAAETVGYSLSDVLYLEEIGLISLELALTLQELLTLTDQITALKEGKLTEQLSLTDLPNLGGRLRLVAGIAVGNVIRTTLELVGDVVERTMFVDDAQFMRMFSVGESLFVSSVIKFSAATATRENLSILERVGVAIELAKQVKELLSIGAVPNFVTLLGLTEAMSLEETASALLRLVLAEPVRLVELFRAAQEVPRSVRQAFTFTDLDALRKGFGLTETLTFDTELAESLLKQLYLSVGIGLQDASRAQQETIRRAIDLARVGDAVLIVFKKAAAEPIVLDAALKASLGTRKLVQSWALGGRPTARQEWLGRALEGVQFVERLAQIFTLTSEEQLTLAAEVFDLLRVKLHQPVAVSAVPRGMLFVPIASRETLRFSEGLDSLQESLRRAAAAFIFVEPGELAETFASWAFNSDSLAVTQYTNFPFNSYMEREGKLYGVSARGLYLLEGDTDDGIPIDALFATGDMSFAHSGVKSVPRAYLLTTTTGELILRTITYYKRQEQEHFYKIVLREDDELGINRVRLRREIRSEFWAFELTNVDGADLDIQGLEVLAIPGSRRI